MFNDFDPPTIVATRIMQSQRGAAEGAALIAELEKVVGGDLGEPEAPTATVAKAIHEYSKALASFRTLLKNRADGIAQSMRTGPHAAF